jgi:glycosyltransferase involved in cell wall biosynthesis
VAKKPLNIYTSVPQKHTASFYYRLQVPLRAAQALQLPVRAVIDTDSASVSNDDRVRIFSESDIILLYQPVGESANQNVRGLQSFLPSKREDGWKWAPTVVVETDDNLFNVSPLNHAFRSLGIRDMNGTEIPLGHHIGVMREGEKKVLWKDGENGFSLVRNRQSVATYRRILEMADAVQCSTPDVESALKREVNPRRTRVFPNCMLMGDYEQVDIRDDPDKIKILWQGGIAHYEDWYPLRQALGNITQKYPQVHWIIWGANFPWVNELVPAHRMTYQGWCPYPEYKLRLAMVGHDINLAPLSDNVFNACRSAIKWYESSVLKKAIPTLAQNTAAYGREMKDGETGLLFNNPEEFESQLSRLIEDAALRKTLGENAKDWVHENRDAMKLAPEIVGFWEQLREERKTEQPHVGDEQWEEIVAEANAEVEQEQPIVPV